MRTAFCMAFCLAVVVGGVPASLARDSGSSDLGKPAGTAVGAKERQSHQRPGSTGGITLEVPIGRISVGPKSLDGEPIYVRRSTVREGMTIVEVSTTPFEPVLASNEVLPPVVRPDQPAGW